MNQHIDNGMARKIENFTDEDGQIFHQYMFTDFYGRDINYIRRIPFGEKGQNKYAYETLKQEYPEFEGINGNMHLGRLKEAFEVDSLDGVRRALRRG